MAVKEYSLNYGAATYFNLHFEEIFMSRVSAKERAYLSFFF